MEMGTWLLMMRKAASESDKYPTAEQGTLDYMAHADVGQRQEKWELCEFQSHKKYKDFAWVQKKWTSKNMYISLTDDLF